MNMSMCTYTTGVDSFTVIAWNPLGQNVSSWLRIPVSGASYTVTDLSTAAVPSQTTAIDARTKQLPQLYLNTANMSAASIANERRALTNRATHVLTFQAALPPAGFSTFSVSKKAATSSADSGVSTPAVFAAATTTLTTVSNGVYSLTVDQATGFVSHVKNIKSGVETDLNISWGYYISSEGDAASKQASGAYMFRSDMHMSIYIYVSFVSDLNISYQTGRTGHPLLQCRRREADS